VCLLPSCIFRTGASTGYPAADLEIPEEIVVKSVCPKVPFGMVLYQCYSKNKNIIKS